MPRYLLKLSGEALGGSAGFGIDPAVLQGIVLEIAEGRKRGLELAIVLGGGNLFRGAALASAGLDRVTGDRMGMLATVMNGLALADFLRRMDVPSVVFSAHSIPGTVRGYERDAADAALEGGEVAILTGGTGNPFFTTDTAACLRGIELGADAVLKATNVDGVYSADPKENPEAKRFESITFDEVLRLELGVMDLTAIVLCKEHAMPVVVFDIGTDGALVEIANGGRVGTFVGE